MKSRSLIIALFTAVVLAGSIFYSSTTNITNETYPEDKKLPRIERKKLRSDYYFNKLKDPKTNEIPVNVRLKELQFSQQLKSQNAAKRTASEHLTWSEIGPSDVGGRTRTIALDSRNSDVVYAGAVSGGIWKSEDGGTTWDAKLAEGSHLSISAIAQDPNAPDTWYASTGEIQDGGSASGKGQGWSYYFGSGVYKSTDNGENWTLMTYADENGDDIFDRQSTSDERITSYLVHPFQLTAKMLIHDFNGVSSIFITTQYEGIWLSTDGGETFARFGDELTGDELPYYADIVIDADDIITVWFGPTASGDNGFFRSYDEGGTFTDVTPNDYPVVSDAARAVCALSPSNPEIMYAFLHDGSQDDFLFKFDYTDLDNGGSSFSSEDRSANLPEFSRSIFGGSEEFSTQQGYDMALAIHPTDPDLVVLGYVNLIKSEDGFATSVTGDPAKYWIGGNDNPWLLDEDYSFEGVHHADQHVLVFDPNSPDLLWSGHDGGISKTADITAERVTWESLNNDYNVTQFYTVSAGFDGADSYIIGGTQDNGTPIIDHASYSGSLLPSQDDVSSGDGSFCYAGNDIIYSSAQEGALSVYTTTDGYFYRFFDRSDLSTLFIHPFAVDPNDEGTLFFSSFGDGILARNASFDEGIANDDTDMIDNGWEDFNYADQVGISAIRVSDQNPSHKLYFGGNLNDEPMLFVWENANTSDDETAIEGWFLEDVELGAWLSDIAINPDNGEEIMLVYSSYNIIGLFHSTDGGQTITAVEGNLHTNDDQASQGYSGPSLRAAEIAVDASGNKKYFVATSIGLFSTSTLDGMNTNWELETGLLDNVVIEDLDYRKKDGALVAGTHGRGIFFGASGESGNTNSAPSIANQSFEIGEDVATGTAVGTIEASDADGDALTFSITSGNSGDVFALDEGSGELSVNASLDFNVTPSYELGIAVNDGQVTSEATVTIDLIEVNSAPSIVNQSFEIDEDLSVGSVVGTVEASDPDDDAITFTLVSGNTCESFAIEEATGELTVSKALDFNDQSEYNLVVEVSDGSLTNEATVTISLNEVVLSVNEELDELLRVYPNPVTNGQVTIELPGQRDLEITVTDVLGRKVVSYKGEDEATSINTAGFNSGYYFMIIRSSGETFTRKLFIPSN